MNPSPLPEPAAIAQVTEMNAATFHGSVRTGGQPIVMRGLVADWPAVKAARSGDQAFVDYLLGCHPSQPVTALAARPQAGGRFFYNERLDGFNFIKANGRLGDFLRDLLNMADKSKPPAMAVQSEILTEFMPEFCQSNHLDLLPDVEPRIWIGNRIRVAPHFDLKENIGCCISGRRRFTLFPPDQLANLYPGPFELTPAGTPISMVDLANPDLDRYPRFAQAWKAALQTTLEPGDAIYIPYTWWHGVDSLDPVSTLVNYWWNDAPEGVAAPYGALLHAILAYRHLPETQRETWRTTLDHYVFERNGDPAGHLPDHAKGILGPPDPELFAQMRAMLKQIVD